PFYPWYVDKKSGIEKFKKAWVHTYEIFKNQGAFNVIWVWNPWKSSNVASFYPGKDYVDWFGVNVLNYGALNEDATWHSFKELYQPFHDEFQNLPSTPVMISEFSTLRWEPNQDEWYDDAFNSIENEYNEIKSLIYFHSNRDNNLSAELMVQARLDWTIPDKNIILKNFYRQNMPDYLFKELPEVNIDAFPIEKRNTKHITNLKGINIKTGRN